MLLRSDQIDSLLWTLNKNIDILKFLKNSKSGSLLSRAIRIDRRYKLLLFLLLFFESVQDLKSMKSRLLSYHI